MISITQQVQAIIVGSFEDDLSRAVARLLGELKVRFSLTENIYSAAVLICRSRGIETLIIGSLSELSRQKMRLFEIASELGNVKCCCITDRYSDFSGQGSHAARACGVEVIDNVEHLRELLAGRSEVTIHNPAYSITEKEMAALFEDN